MLVLRVWWEPGEADGLRARILTEDSAIDAGHPSVACAGVEEVLHVVRRWLVAFEAAGVTREPHDPPPATRGRP